MNTISLNEKFILQFVTPLRDYERDLVLLIKLGYAPTYKDVTKENLPLHYAEGRPEVVFDVEVKNVNDAAFLRDALLKSNRAN